MPRVLSLLLPALAAFLAGCPVLPDDTPVLEFKRTVPKTGADYYLYVPSTYDAARRWPMVVTLHGTYGFDSARREAQEWRGLAERHGFLVLAPALKSTQGVLPVFQSARLRDLARDEARVLEMIAHVKGDYSVDGAAVMITGFSAGGYPLFYIALRHPELFSVLVARTCSSDLDVIKSLPITDKARAMPMLIFFSKTGVNPINSNWNPVARESWATFRWLYEQGCTAAEIKAVSGGHHRKPQRAFEFWREHQPQLRRSQPRR
ncbi:MAG TPA: PHB depolymerase family esterase [Phycisphaerae bacterium]|nr:PHB depolymerase family esterase [Phycisphaerae bacterium]